MRLKTYLSANLWTVGPKYIICWTICLDFFSKFNVAVIKILITIFIKLADRAINALNPPATLVTTRPETQIITRPAPVPIIPGN